MHKFLRSRRYAFRGVSLYMHSRSVAWLLDTPKPETRNMSLYGALRESGLKPAIRFLDLETLKRLLAFKIWYVFTIESRDRQKIPFIVPVKRVYNNVNN